MTRHDFDPSTVTPDGRPATQATLLDHTTGGPWRGNVAGALLGGPVTRAGYEGAKRKRGSEVHLAVDTLGHLLALHVTPADVGDRTAVKRLAADIQDATGDSVRLADVDQGYTAETAADAAEAEGIALHVVKLPEVKRGFVLLPRRWVVERSFAWATRCRRLVKNYERYDSTLAGFHVIAFVEYRLKHAAELMRNV